MNKKPIILLLAMSALCLIFGLAGCYNTPSRPNKQGSFGSDGFINEFPYIRGTKGLEYEYDPETDSYSCTGPGTAFDTEIIIYSRIDGKPVTSIGENAFENCKDIESIIIPSSVTSIGGGTFGGCTSLTSVKIGNGVTSIGKGAFSGCTSLASITVPDNVSSIGEGTFSGCSSLENITLPFAGGNKDAATPNKSTLFGYIFGTGSYAESTAAAQFCGSAYATYYIPNSLKSVTITGGNILYGTFCNCTGLESITIPESVTAIGDEGFSGCTSLENIVIPESVTYIGFKAFYGCESLGNIIIPESVTAIGDETFSGCTSLESIVIPEGVTYIEGNAAFSGCTSLKNITIPESVTSIGDWAFYGCESLKSIAIPNSVNHIGYSAFDDCRSLKSITIPESVTYIEQYAFNFCTSLTSVTIGRNVNFIGDGAFSDCCKLVEVINLSALPIQEGESSYGGVAYNALNVYNDENYVSRLTVIADGYMFYVDGETSYLLGYAGNDTQLQLPENFNGDNYEICKYAFYYCTNLKSVTIPDGVTHIGYNAFYNCTGLESVSIGNGVDSIEEETFMWCTGLTSVSIGNGVTSIGEKAFTKCTSLESITIGSGVTSIGESTFDFCENLENVYITDLKVWCNVEFGDSYSNPFIYAQNLYLNNNLVTEITADMLQGITEIGLGLGGYDNLTSITIPESVTSIREHAFWGCFNLTDITIPSSLTSIGWSAFYDCNSLTRVNITDLKAWCSIAFADSWGNPLYYAHNLYLNGNLVTEITADMLQGTTIICASSFAGFSGTSISMPESVLSIGNAAFWGCENLISVKIGSGVIYIGGEAFRDCTSLVSIIIPKSVTYIGSMAFYGCKSLKGVTFENTTGWQVADTSPSSRPKDMNVTYAEQNAKYLTDRYYSYYWKRVDNA